MVQANIPKAARMPKVVESCDRGVWALHEPERRRSASSCHAQIIDAKGRWQMVLRSMGNVEYGPAYTAERESVARCLMPRPYRDALLAHTQAFDACAVAPDALAHEVRTNAQRDS
jgi:hypothetical protein